MTSLALELDRLKTDLGKITDTSYVLLDHPEMTDTHADVLEKAMDCFEGLPDLLDSIVTDLQKKKKPSVAKKQRKAAHAQKFSPMLAKDYKDYQGRIDFPAFVQPKLDGVRLVTTKNDGSVIFRSRTDKNASSGIHPDLRKVLLDYLPEGIVLDGEMYAPDIAFQELVHRYKKPDSKMLSYYVYDMYDPETPEMPFEERTKRLQSILAPMATRTPYVVAVPTTLIRSQADLDKAHKNFVSKGFEGTMIRARSAPYRMTRTADLLKRKDFDTDEFRIVGAKPGKGAHAGAVVWDLETSTGSRFHAVMKAPLNERRRMFQNQDRYIGKMLTVQFQGTSRDGIPRFPVGISVRDYE
jgi:ATP-dependent DNA ligase